MQAGEIGVLITVFSNSVARLVDAVKMTGATTNLVVTSPAGVRTSLSLAVSADGLSATRSSLATDFPTPGSWQVQLVASYPGGNLLKSLPQTLLIGPAL